MVRIPPTEPEEIPFADRVQNRRAAMSLAHRQALSGCPIAGAFFGFLHSIRNDHNAAFLDDFYEVDFEDDSDQVRPY